MHECARTRIIQEFVHVQRIMRTCARAGPPAPLRNLMASDEWETALLDWDAACAEADATAKLAKRPREPAPAAGAAGVDVKHSAPSAERSYDMNTAPAELLIKAGLTEVLVQNLLKARAGALWDAENPFMEANGGWQK